MKRKFAASFVTGLVMLGMAGMANAALFQGDSGGIFTNPDAGYNTGVGTSHFATGTGTPTRLDFSGTSFDVDADTSFVFGELTYFNGATTAGSTASTVDLEVSIDLTAPLGLSEDFNYNLTFNMTPNVGSAEDAADYLYLPTIQPSTSFTYGGVDYTLAFTGFGSIDSNGFVTTVDQFHVYEGYSASAQLIGQFTQHSVPEPASMLLMFAGLAGIGFAKRKKI